MIEVFLGVLCVLAVQFEGLFLQNRGVSLIVSSSPQSETVYESYGGVCHDTEA